MDVFLFPLVNVTLFPKTTKPLNIFENRYIEMVRDSVSTQTPVAIGFIEDPSKVYNVKPGERVEFVRDIVGFGIPQIMEERSNGTLLVFIQGQGKARLGRVKASTTSYLVCDAQVLPENIEVNPSLRASVHALNKILARWIQTHIPDQMQREIFMRNMTGPEEIIGAFASYLIRDYDLQQMALEFDDINKKNRISLPSC